MFVVLGTDRLVKHKHKQRSHNNYLFPIVHSIYISMSCMALLFLSQLFPPLDTFL